MWRIWVGLGAVLLLAWIVVELLYVSRSPWLFNDSMLGNALQTHVVRRLLGLFGGGVLALGLWERHDSTPRNSAVGPK